jgi:hypothetical protein
MKGGYDLRIVSLSSADVLCCLTVFDRLLGSSWPDMANHNSSRQ